MLNPISLEIIVEDVQTERRHEAELSRLTKEGKAPLFRLPNFLKNLGAKEKEQPQTYPSATPVAR